MTGTRVILVDILLYILQSYDQEIIASAYKVIIVGFNFLCKVLDVLEIILGLNNSPEMGEIEIKSPDFCREKLKETLRNGGGKCNK